MPRGDGTGPVGGKGPGTGSGRGTGAGQVRNNGILAFFIKILWIFFGVGQGRK